MAAMPVIFGFPGGVPGHFRSAYGLRRNSSVMSFMVPSAPTL